MEIPPEAINEAKEIINASLELPAEINGFLGYWVAEQGDESVQALAAFTHNRTTYKIGVKYL